MSKDENSTYYDAGGIETLDVIKAKLTPEQYQGFLLGNAIKYQLRMMHKTPDNPGRDAEKAANYSRWLSDYLNKYVKDKGAARYEKTKQPTTSGRKTERSAAATGAGTDGSGFRAR